MLSTARTTTLAFLLGACAARTGAPGARSTLPLPGLDVAFERLDGRRSNLLDYAGEPTLLVLFATFDSPSHVLLARLVPIAERFSPRGLRVLAIAVQPDARTFAREFRDFLRIPFEVGAASEELLAGETSLGTVAVVPALILIDRDGEVRRTHTGIVDAATIESWLAALRL